MRTALPSRPRAGRRARRWLRFAGGAYACHLWTLFGLALSNGLLGIAALTLPWASPAVRRRWRRLRPLCLPLSLYVLSLLASTALSHDPARSAGALGELFGLGTLLLAPLVLVGLRSVQRVVDGFLYSAGLCAVWGLAQFALGYGDLDRRILGPFSHTMTFAGVLLLADLLLIARLLLRESERRKWPLWVLLAVFNLALLGSLTRSAWLGVVLTLTALLALRAPRLLWAYLPASALFLILAPAPVISRVTSIADLHDNYDRLCMIEAGLQMVRQRPIFGLGPNMAEELYPLYRHPTSERPRTPHLHNTVVQIAAERGLLGVTAYLSLLGMALLYAYRGYRATQHRDPARAALFLGAVLGLVAFSCAGLFEDNWGDTEVQRVVLLLLALPFLIGQGRRRREPGEGRAQ